MTVIAAEKHAPDLGPAAEATAAPPPDILAAGHDSPAPPQAGGHALARFIGIWALRLGALAFGVLVWHLAVAVKFNWIISFQNVPSPLAVWNALWHGDTDWTKHLWVTTLEIIGAFFLAAGVGVALGVAIAWSPLIANALVPFLVFVNTLPKVAIAPLFLIWMGYGIFPNMLMGALIGFFPVVINTAVGLSQVEADMLDLGRVFNAPKWKIFVKIRIPNALPYILSALKITATAAVVGAIVGEFVASQKGLGYVIVTTQSSMNTSVAFAALIWISVVGLLLYGAVALAAQLWAPWAEGID